ncbi:hypothetical protein D9619_009187 [Psilocybe cf. subviscida]|uniref:Uncharacterized protein n=1 Tax=Psilocybe cf. subviscida TaxID=2480587 RepID=A0A8H5BUA4_9AGAR|nr:hypothetical protein D9619_009187 [Psilocybe cf. subviscida]
MQHPSINPQAGPSNSVKTRYHVETTDVLQDMKVHVSEEGSDKVIWYKERFLTDTEIVENLVHNPTSTIYWTIHRPLRGWYIRIRAPSFPPGVFIPLTPVPPSSSFHTEAALSFNTRTNIPVSGGPSHQLRSIPLDDTKGINATPRSSSSSSASDHSYPPTPTTTTPTQSTTNLSKTHSVASSSSSTRSSITNNSRSSTGGRPITSSQITQFVLSAHSSQPVETPQNASFFSRALSVLKSHRPSHSNSFTLSRVLAPSNMSAPPPPYASNASLTTLPSITSQPGHSTTAILEPQQHLHHPPLLVFHDQTPVLTVRSLSGLLEVEKAEEEFLGVDTSFWIAVALTYLEFLEDRESYLAASSD